MAVLPFLTAGTIARRNVELAREIERAYYSNLIVMPVLTSAFVFAADLIRALAMHCEVQFMSVTRDGLVDNINLPQGTVKGRDILIVDDAVGTAYTLAKARDELSKQGAHRVATCALLDVPEKRRVPLTVDHIGFTCVDYYYVGYGMDSDSGLYRGLPYIGICDDGDDAAYHAKMAMMPEALK